MIGTMNELSLINSEIFNEIDGSFDVIEEVFDESKNPKTLKHTMKLTVRSNGEENLVHLFCEEKAKAKRKERSRILFLKDSAFPDSIFVKTNKDNRFECFICELKTTPLNKYDQLASQLYNGYLHVKTLFSLLNISEENIEFNFIVPLINDSTPQIDFNENEDPLFLKTIPAEEAAPIINDKYHYWNNDKVLYEKDEFVKEMGIKKIPLSLIRSSYYEDTFNI